MVHEMMGLVTYMPPRLRAKISSLEDFSEEIEEIINSMPPKRRKTQEQLAVLTRLYRQAPNPMTGWGREHTASFQEAVELTGLSEKQIKVSYTPPLIPHLVTTNSYSHRACTVFNFLTSRYVLRKVSRHKHKILKDKKADMRTELGLLSTIYCLNHTIMMSCYMHHRCRAICKQLHTFLKEKYDSSYASRSCPSRNKKSNIITRCTFL